MRRAVTPRHRVEPGRRSSAGRLSTLLFGAAFLLAAPAAHSQTTSAISPAPSREIRIEFVVTSLRGEPITNIRPSEVVLVHNGERQEITAFAYDPTRRVYELRYHPPGDRAGAVGLRLSRRGTQVDGPDGGPLAPLWVTQARDPESPLEDALGQADPPSSVAFTQKAFRFGLEPGGRHVTVAVALDPATARRQIAVLTRVLDSASHVVCQQSNAETVDPGMVATWSAHCHLLPGDYSAETAIQDATANVFGVQREVLHVTAPEGRLDTGSLVLLKGTSPMLPSEKEGEDNPLRFGGSLFIPSVKDSFVVGTQKMLFELTIIPAAMSTAPAAVLSVVHDGRSIINTPIQLPPPEKSGEIVAFGSIPSSSWAAGSYELCIDVRQANQEAVERAHFVVDANTVYRIGGPAVAVPR